MNKKILQNFILSVFLYSFTSSFLFIGCTQNENSHPSKSFFPEIGSFFPLWSTRPQHQKQFLALIKLRSPPLLTYKKKIKGQWKIPVDKITSIETEQNLFIVELKKMSSQIQIIYQYRMVLNGMTILAPSELIDKIQSSSHVAYMESENTFGRPQVIEYNRNRDTQIKDLMNYNSVKFIGSEDAWQRNLNGDKVKIGIIDTGIDYTHSMFLGKGTPEAFKTNNPQLPSPDFPNKKVVGGIDLVGSQYNGDSGDFNNHIPHPDDNPIDESGHGTHVAATVAGIGDGINSHSGVAPGALLYAIKIFGAIGSTQDAAVIAALEYSADPDHTANPDKQLDIVNLSLGDPFGSNHNLYQEAIYNLTRSGTLVVASAGNLGDVDYAVSAPSVMTEALSVAASVDNALHNWQYPAVKFETSKGNSFLAPPVEARFTKPIKELGPVTGDLVYLGFGDMDLQPDSLKGKIALFDRGNIIFNEKVRKVFSVGGAGVIIINTPTSEPFNMTGGSEIYPIPSIMVTQSFGDLLKSELQSGPIQVNFKPEERILKPENIDTITYFSSKGPRSIDSALKPEITAPGQNIVSAAFGQGNLTLTMSGTSMAAPHISGAAAILKQAYPEASIETIKSLLMQQAKPLKQQGSNYYPLSRQGSGRVQIINSLDAEIVAYPASISFGELPIETQKMIRSQIILENLTNNTLTYKVNFDPNTKGIELINEGNTVKVPPYSKVTVLLSFLLNSKSMENAIFNEMSGWVKLTSDGMEKLRIPVFAITHRISDIKTTDLVVYSESENDSFGSAVDLKLINKASLSGDVLIFNLVGEDFRKENLFQDPYWAGDCDLQAIGYRLIPRSINGVEKLFLQFAVKLFEPITTWNLCEISILIDNNEDELPEQELVAGSSSNIKGIGGLYPTNAIFSFLFDSTTLRIIRKQFEEYYSRNTSGKNSNGYPSENYSSALRGASLMKPYNHSTIQIVEAQVSSLSQRPSGELAFKVLVHSFESSNGNSDDFFHRGSQWEKISLSQESQSFMNIPELVTVEANQSYLVPLNKGYGTEKLLILYPHNRTVFSRLLIDSQLEISKPTWNSQE